MGKKNKKEKKGKGAEKTSRKADKNLQKKMKKIQTEAGEDDVEVMVAMYKGDGSKSEVTENKCDPPSSRINFSLTANRSREEMYLFGGEYDNGSKTTMFNDFFVFNCKKREWRQIVASNAPPPRSSHQAVLVRSGHGDQLWLFGGEFVSPKETQFHHFRDLWCWHLKERRWEEIKAGNGPHARSGHRMVLWKKCLIVFGGFFDNGSRCTYFNDLWQFDLSTRQWVELVPAKGSSPPAARSACLLLASADQTALYVVGGYSRRVASSQSGRGAAAKDDEGQVFGDLHQLTVPAAKGTSDGDAHGASAAPGPVQEVRWRPMKWSGMVPEPVRAGMSAVCGEGVPGGGAMVFGGVHDDYEGAETVHSRFFNDMFRLDLERGRWYQCSYKTRPSEVDVEKMEALALGEAQEEEITTVSDDGVFTLTVGGRAEVEDTPSTEGDQKEAGKVPVGRMNCGLAVVGHRLFLYGGQIETEKKVRVLNDLHCLDLRRMDAWECIDAGCDSEWVGEESESEGEESNEEMEVGEEEDYSEDSEEDEDDLLLEAPPPKSGESFSCYFSRTDTFWFHVVLNGDEEVDDLNDAAMKIAKSVFKKLNS